MSALDDYMEALDRLIEGRPQIIVGKYRINKDTVAIEAGRKRGSIKKSRPEHFRLIHAIEIASSNQKPIDEKKADAWQVRYERLKEEMSKVKTERDIALSKLVAAIHHNYQLQNEILRLGGNSVSITNATKLGKEV